MGKGPLDHPRLSPIEKHLDRGELDAAQRLLADLGDLTLFRHAISYLATRLLFERGRLDASAVAERLRDVVEPSSTFPEAEAMLEAAERGVLERGSTTFKTRPVAEPPRTVADEPTNVHTVDVDAELDLDAELHPKPPDDPEQLFEGRRSGPSLPSIPRAAPVPALDVPADPRPIATSTGVAGRYSEAPSDAERVEALLLGAPAARQPKRPAAPLAPSEPARKSHNLAVIGDSRAAAAVAPAPDPAAASIRSGRPPILSASYVPSLFELATLVDDGRFAEVLEAIDRLGPALSPDQVMLRARALSGSGRAKEALEVIERLGCAPLLDPEMRAAVARLMLDLGAPEAALEQAKKAHDDDPEPPLVRLTLACASLRVERRSGDVLLMGDADGLLQSLNTRDDPMPALVFALRACVLSELGDPEQAVSLAQRALSLDAHSLDALAALAIASARLERPRDTEQAVARLAAMHPDEARAVQRALTELGPSPSSASARSSPPSSRSGWSALELAVYAGRRDDAIDAFERLCRERLDQFGPRGAGDAFVEMATAAAMLLTTAPVTQHFAPYDFSLFSIGRVDAALTALYGPGARPKPHGDERGVIELVGAYLGETMCQAHDGTWHGTRLTLDDASVTSTEGEWRPFRSVLARLHYGEKLELARAGTALAHPGAEPWGHRMPILVAPPTPWDPDEWPDPQRMPELGRALSRSVVSRYLRDFAIGPLDISITSLAALEIWLGLISPTRAPPPGAEEPWLRRAGVLGGAYLGEVLRAALGGSWAARRKPGLRPDSYVLVLPDGRELVPVEQVFRRLTHETKTSVGEYAARLFCR